MKSERLMSLDVFRGITIAAMILVNNPGTWDYVYPPLRHADWNGCTPTDLIFPFFLFIVGVAITFSLSKKKADKQTINKTIVSIIKRSATLFLLGLFLNTFPIFDFSTIRIPGVLQRIAVVYLFSSVLFLKMDNKNLIYIGSAILLIYWVLMTLVPVPGVGYANLEPAKNLAAWLDNTLLNGHLWRISKVWDPEGILPTLPAISSTIIGISAGRWLKSENDQAKKTVWLFVWGNVLLLIGYVWDGWFPINKNLWTSSYVIFTGGYSLVFFAMCYWIIDVQGYKKWPKPFQVYGMNAIAVYFLSGIMTLTFFYTNVNSNGKTVSLHDYLFSNLFLSWLEPINASLMWGISFILVWLGLMWILYYKKIFIKV